MRVLGAVLVAGAQALETLPLLVGGAYADGLGQRLPAAASPARRFESAASRLCES